MPEPKNLNHLVTLVVGGSRSGKSLYAQAVAERLCPRPAYLATSEILDPEMVERVRLHRAQRGSQWITLEEPLEIASLLLGPRDGFDGFLVDCMTLWLTNVMLKEGLKALPARKTALLEALRRVDCPVVLVTNEVGMGIVPDNALARDFRDQAGWLNQDLAVVAGRVVFVAVGLPLTLKGPPLCVD
jgi:adenosylcobinamide kinase/adenosylcobinamide-phosphate guanylyltransferase